MRALRPRWYDTVMTTVLFRLKARIAVCGIMLALAFIGLIVMDVHPKSYWLYCRLMSLAYAILSLWLFWILNRNGKTSFSSTFWHQLAHWTGLVASLYLVSLFVNSGIIGSMQAGLVTLTLLALTIFLAGVYSNISFVLIGITLGVFAAGAALVEAYLSVMMIPVVLIAGVMIYYLAHREKKKAMDRAT